jgi:phosphoribosyl-ATP pyrophosphohydrolase/phosphoribosyl-AMP cyclohydrolase
MVRLAVADVNFDERGLVPAIVRDASTGTILMLASMNRESLQKTIDSGETWFWSPSRQEVVHQGATSGNRQKVFWIARDCDGDALIVDVRSLGPACHTGRTSCFEDTEHPNLDFRPLMAILQRRKGERPEGSYSTYLFNEGLDTILKKIGEETAEVLIAAKNDDKQRVVEEIGDLVYHLLVLMVNEGVSLADVSDELRRRRGQPGGGRHEVPEEEEE